jgi:hypothetical protein
LAEADNVLVEVWLSEKGGMGVVRTADIDWF